MNTLLPRLKLAYYRTVEATGGLELYVQLADGTAHVQEINDARLKAHLAQLNDHVISRFPGER